MLFIFIVFLTAFLMEGIGSYISVVGLNSTFAGNHIILAFAVMLDIAKIVTVSIVYKYWDRLSRLALCYMIPAVIVTMAITSYGAFGYLSSAFQTAVSPNKEVTTKLELLESERLQLISERDAILTRKQKIDDQVANLPPEMVRGRTRLINTFKPEIERLNADLKRTSDRVVEITSEIPTLKNQNLDTQQHVGPVAFLSQSLGLSMDDAIMYVILVLVFVFDPLAVMLVISGNFILKIHQEEREEKRIRKLKEEHERREFEQARELELIHLEKERVDNDKEIQLAAIAIEEGRLELETHKAAETSAMAALFSGGQSTDTIPVAPPGGDSDVLLELSEEVLTTETKPPRKRRKSIDEPRPLVKDPGELEKALKIETVLPEEIEKIVVQSIPPSTSIWAQDNSIEDSNEIVLPESLMDTLLVDHALSNVMPDSNHGKPKWSGESLLNFYKQHSPFQV